MLPYVFLALSLLLCFRSVYISSWVDLCSLLDFCFCSFVAPWSTVSLYTDYVAEMTINLLNVTIGLPSGFGLSLISVFMYNLPVMINLSAFCTLHLDLSWLNCDSPRSPFMGFHSLSCQDFFPSPLYPVLIGCLMNICTLSLLWLAAMNGSLKKAVWSEILLINSVSMGGEGSALGWIGHLYDEMVKFKFFPYLDWMVWSVNSVFMCYIELLIWPI